MKNAMKKKSRVDRIRKNTNHTCTNMNPIGRRLIPTRKYTDKYNNAEETITIPEQEIQEPTVTVTEIQVDRRLQN